MISLTDVGKRAAFLSDPQRAIAGSGLPAPLQEILGSGDLTEIWRKIEEEGGIGDWLAMVMCVPPPPEPPGLPPDLPPPPPPDRPDE